MNPTLRTKLESDSKQIRNRLCKLATLNWLSELGSKDEAVVEELVGDKSEQGSSAREEEMKELLRKGRFGCGGEDGDDGLVMIMMVMDGVYIGRDGEDDVAGDGEDDDESGGDRDEGDVVAVVGGDGEEL